MKGSIHGYLNSYSNPGQGPVNRRLYATCSVEASEAIAAGVPHAVLAVFESSGHMTFVEENDAYIRTVRDFLRRHPRPG